LWPDLPDDVTGDELDQEVFLGDLRGLTADNARWVARHLVMVARTIDEDPELAWEHAQAAVRRAGRIAAVREAAGLAAYRAGHFARALTELRAARRMSGLDTQLPVIADCERGLGRPERTLEIAGSAPVARLDQAGRIEMRIVAAGARRDMGQLDAALVTLQCPELSQSDTVWGPRLRYAYADTLVDLGRLDEAAHWFDKAAQVDVEGMTDAEDRFVELLSAGATDVREASPSIAPPADEVTFMDLGE
jgi:tetratricopeptide (TPR) repeat protein